MSHLPVRPARQGRQSRTLRRVQAGVLVVLVAGGLLATPAAGQPVPTGDAAGADRSHTSTGEGPAVADGEGEVGGPTGGSLAFEENRGQFADEVAFAARRGRAAVSLTRSAEMVVGLGEGTGVAMELVGGADGPAVAGRDRAAGETNYLRGDPDEWVRGVGSYREVVYEQVYAGIDLVVRASETGWPRYDFQLEPGADPSAVRLGFDGAEGLTVDDDGDLRIATDGGGEVVQRRPYAYQTVDGERREVAAEFAVIDGRTVAFELGDYDPARPLVIDPEVEFSAYFGGSGLDQVTGVAADGDGNSYAVGRTFSTNLPTTDGAYQQDDEDLSGFVVKYAPEGAVRYATYFDNVPLAVAVDGDGRVHLTGLGRESFPATEDAYQSEPSDGTDAFVARLSTDGAELEYGTYLGPAGRGRAIAVDDDGRVSVAGITGSDGFPATDDAHQGERGGGDDVFVTVLDPGAGDSSAALQYATYLGGSSDEGANDRVGLAVDAYGRVHVGGTTTSADFPTPDGAHQPDMPDPHCDVKTAALQDCNPSGFVAVLEPHDGGALVYASYLGGSATDEVDDVAVAGTSLAVAGTTNSCDFPTTDGAYRSEPRPATTPDSCQDDVFAARWVVPPPSSDADPSVEYATLLGVAPFTSVRAGVDDLGRAHLTGGTRSDEFPTTDDALQGDRAGQSDAFVASLAPDGSELEFSTYWGGASYDYGTGIAVDASGALTALTVGGTTESEDFPTRGDAAQPENPPPPAGWVARFTLDDDPHAPRISAITPDQGPSVGGPVTLTGEQLGQVSQVRFGAATVACPSPRCDIASDRELRITAPPHPDGEGETGEVDVRAENEHGPSPAVRFRYTDGIWETTASLAWARYGHRATLLPDGTILVAGCSRSVEREEADEVVTEGDCPGHSEVYDPLERNWSITGGPEPTGPMVLLEDGQATDCGPNCGKVLVVACISVDERSSCSGEGGLYDPLSGTWAPAPPPARPKDAAAARLDDGRVLSTGDDSGACGDSDARHSSSLFDPRTGAWTPAARLNHDRARFHTLTLLPDGTVLATGGIRSGGIVDPDCQGGVNSPPERFYPDAEGDGPGEGAWRETADQLDRRFAAFTATLLTGGAAGRCGEDCGNVMIAGGTYGIDNFTGDVELYDPDADRWRPTAALPRKVGAHTATELPSGKVLVTGGRSSQLAGKAAAAEVYDPVTRRWQSAGRMHRARGTVVEAPNHPRHTATVISSDAYEFAADPEVCGLDCGKVLIAGGSGDASAELYTPAPVVTDVSPGEADAAGGAIVTIEGTGFTHGVREVRFGGQTVDCTAPQELGQLPQSGGDCRVIDYSTLEVEVPAAAGALNVPVEVITDAGFAAADEPFSYTGAPGRVDDLAAEATSASEVTLSWSAVGQTGQFEPPAGEYVVVHSDEPIGDADDFDSASVLCGGVCDAFDPSPAAVGDGLELTVGGLAADTTHHFAVAALDPDGRRGPVSDSVSATTLADDGDDDGEDDGDGGDGGDLPGFDDDDGGDAGDGGGDAPVAPLEGGVLRLAGADRIATAVAASQEAFADDEAGAVVVARADVFADGLAGVPLAAAENAPLLLTGSDELDSRSQAELQRVLADGGEVFLLGGTAALSDAVEQQVAALSYVPRRLAGADRFATAVAIAEDGLGAPDRVLVTTGGVFADAVTAGAAGARHGAAVVLTAGDQLPAATAAYLDRHQPGEQIAVGGPAARAVPDMAALVGATRFETAATVADALFAEPAAVGVATGLRFPDALSGGAHIARYQGPMLLSGPDRLHPAAASYLASRRAHLQSGVIYGGTAALSPAVENQLGDALP